jgi:chromosome segregation ATPase
MHSHLDHVRRLYDEACEQRDRAVRLVASQASEISGAAENLRAAVDAGERASRSRADADAEVFRALALELDEANAALVEVRNERDLLRDELGRHEGVAAEHEKTSDRLRKRIEDLEEDARQMRRVSNLVVLERKVADLQRENDILKKSLANARVMAGAREPVRVKTIKDKRYYASEDSLYDMCDDGTKGARVASLTRDDQGRTKVVWL